jgi:two-component system, LytTR family, response regulator LytT
MRILIVEDEQPIAEDLQELCRKLLGDRLEVVHVELTLGNAREYLAQKRIDLLLLDLNLSGRNGFDLLKEAVSYSFHTIVVSANIDRAIEAFEYGVIDFVPKPYSEERVAKALDRCDHSELFQNHGVKFLSVRKTGGIRLVAIADLMYVKGANVYSELVSRNGDKELYDKTLDDLSRILPGNFFRIHKSYIVDTTAVKDVIVRGSGKYAIALHSQEILPVSRTRYAALKKKLAPSQQ